MCKFPRAVDPLFQKLFVELQVGVTGPGLWASESGVTESTSSVARAGSSRILEVHCTGSNLADPRSPGSSGLYHKNYYYVN